jgi:ABC-type antimicrobial peptide transport system permease subunit
MQQHIRVNLGMERFVAGMATVFAVLATVLAALGVYGVLSYSVAQRSREIGLRIALGARSASVRGMIFRQVAAMVLAGAALGVLAMLLVGRTVHNLLFGIESNDPLTIVAAVVLVATVTLSASYFPARRASRIDPVAALRSE